MKTWRPFTTVLAAQLHVVRKKKKQQLILPDSSFKSEDDPLISHGDKTASLHSADAGGLGFGVYTVQSVDPPCFGSAQSPGWL